MGKNRLDQDIFFTLVHNRSGKSVKCRLVLDTTYPGPEDMYIITATEPVNRTIAQIVTVNISMSYEKFADDIHENYCDDSMRLTILVMPPEECIGVSAGIFVSLPDWDGDSFDFMGAAGFINLLNNLKEVEPEIEFFRGDGEKIQIPPKVV